MDGLVTMPRSVVATKSITNDFEKVIKGLYKTADVVGSTMGAMGKNVIIADNAGLRFTKDGISVASSINLEDEHENIGARLVINSSDKTVKEAGDGTTATAVILRSLVEKFKEDGHPNSRLLLEELEEQVNDIVRKIKERAEKVESVEDIKNVATIASNSSSLGDDISKIYEEVGMDSLVELDSNLSDTHRTEYEVVKGFKFKNGYFHRNFANTKQGECVLEKAYIMIEDSIIRNHDGYVKLLQESLDQNIPLVVFAPDFSSNFLRFILSNIRKSGVEVCLIKTPGFGEGRLEDIKDINAIISPDGTVDKIVVTQYDFVIYNETDNQEKIAARIDELRGMIEGEKDIYYTDSYTERIHKLNSSAAVIYAGGVTEKNAREEWDRIEDALESVKAAIRGGYVPGGGSTLYNIVNSGRYHYILREACTAPIRQILKNADIEFDGNLGSEEVWDVISNTKVNYKASGIIDPAEVVINALTNAFASLKLLMNSNYVINNRVQ